jgi:hypothetical protein
VQNPFSKISQVRLAGGGGGAIKALRGFDKSRHSVPDAVNAATTAFLSRLCAAELAEEAEGMFQRARAALGYKRAGITLDVVRRHLETAFAGTEEVRTAVIWYKALSMFKPDYFVQYLPENPWIHQPFENYDMMDADALLSRGAG